MNSVDMGKKGEDIACRFIQSRGFSIIMRNYRKNWGEIDIVARWINVKSSTNVIGGYASGKDVSRETWSAAIHFFEVKSISVASFNQISEDGHFRGHSPEENVHIFKSKQIRRMIETYHMEYTDQKKTNTSPYFFFHIICVFLNEKSRKAKVKWMKDIIL